MKYITAIIQPHMLDQVMASLEKVGVNLLTVSNVLGRGRQKGVTEIYRGARESGNLLKKVKIEIGVGDDYAEPAIEALIKGARTGGIGDGKIFMYDLDEAVRISTGERGEKAIG
ncbi:MAG: P-II family nitrogen regulator [Syntrophaceae bacterium]